MLYYKIYFGHRAARNWGDFMNIAIVDDEREKAEELAALLREYASIGKLEADLRIFDSAEELLESYRPFAYTAIFMDIYMNGIDGVTAAEQILERDRRAIVIFLTSSDEHMPEAFSLHAYDYIAKPAKRERIFKVMDDLLLRLTEANASPKLTFVCEKREFSLAFPDIVCVKTARHNYLEITEASGEKYLTRLTFSEVQKQLEADPRFLPILRGILVNMDFISRMEKGLCRLKTGEDLPLNIKNAGELTATWQNYRLDSIRASRHERRKKI